MQRTFWLAALAGLTTACATTDRAGVRDPETFRQVAERTVIKSARPYRLVARCFEDRAALLPMTAFIPDEPENRTTYRLRGYGFTFEEVVFEPAGDGSRITVLLAPNLNEKWRKDFRHDRGAALDACAAG